MNFLQLLTGYTCMYVCVVHVQVFTDHNTYVCTLILETVIPILTPAQQPNTLSHISYPTSEKCLATHNHHRRQDPFFFEKTKQ